MAERWQVLNDVVRPLDKAAEGGLGVLKKLGLYDPFRTQLFKLMRANLRAQFRRDNALEIVGLENVPKEGGAIFAPNHQSWLDVQVVAAASERRVHFVAKSMFQTWPFLRHMIDLSDSLYIRRGGDTAGLSAVADALRGGKVVCIFPEGTIPGEEDVPRWAVEDHTGLLRGRTGAVRLAIMAGVPIIPVGLSGTGMALPPEAYPRLQELPMRRNAPITIRFGKPIELPRRPVESFSHDEIRAMTDDVMGALSGLIDHERNHVPVRVPVVRKTKPEGTPRYALRSQPAERATKAPVGVLVLHGFTSDIATVAAVEPLLKARNLPYRFPILRGHGTRPEDLVGVTSKDWYRDGEDALLELLDECEKVVVMGLSMGGLVALELAARHFDRVAGVITAGAALRFADPLSGLSPLLAKLVGFWPSPNAYHDRECAKANRNYPRFPTESFVSLLRYGNEVLNLLSFVKAPIAILQSRRDQVVAPRSAEIIRDKVSSKDRRIVWFEKSGHEMFLDLEAEAVVAAVGTHLDAMLPAAAAAEAVA